jgi:hypothetical protein
VTDKGYDMPWLRSVTHYLSQMCPKWLVDILSRPIA